MRRVALIVLFLTAALVAGGCRASAPPEAEPERVLAPSGSRPVEYSVDELGLFATTTVSDDSTVTCTAALVRSTATASGEATLAVGVEVIAPVTPGDLATISLIGEDGTERSLDTLAVEGYSSPQARMVGMSGFEYALPPDTEIVRVRFHVDSTGSAARTSVWIDIPLEVIPVVQDEVIGFYHPFGTSITF